MPRILIAENIPSLNKGELAILYGILENLKYFDNCKVSIFSSNFVLDNKRYPKFVNIVKIEFNTELISFNETLNNFILSLIFTFKHVLFIAFYFFLKEYSIYLMKADIWKSYLKADLIFIGHNGVFGIGNGLISENAWITYMSYLYIPFLRLVLKKPFVIYGGSIDSYKKNNILIRKWMQFVLNKIDLITLRDNTSYQNLRSMGLSERKFFLTADLAFLLRPVNEDIVNEIFKKENIQMSHRKLVGITVTSEMAYKFSQLNGCNNNDHNQLFAIVIDYLIEKYECEIIFLPHSIGYGNIADDRVISRHILQHSSHKKRINIITNEYNPSELKGLIGKFDIFIGERLHSVIGALSMKIPSIVITYPGDRRLDIIKMLDQSEYTLTLEKLDFSIFKSKIDKLFDNKNYISNNLNEKIEEIENKALKNVFILNKLLNDFY